MATMLSVPLPLEVEADLEQLAIERRSDVAALAAAALTDFVERERRTTAMIREGMADAAAGRTASHAAVMADVWAVIEAAEAERAKASAE